MAGTTSTIPITIGTTVIQFPNTGSSPAWSPAVIQFAEAVSLALQASGSPFNVAPTVQTLSNNLNASINLTGSGSNLSFPSGSVASFTFTYSVYRVSSSTSKTQEGVVTGVFNTVTSTWSLRHVFGGDVQSDGTPFCTFEINGSDELLLSTAIIAGTYTTGRISYSAVTELVST
jgi:hypothetical protein